ncbi:TIGR02678 family protein [Streptomyces profundus]|uniref:TIGR02678 family protein n=1 Tax=Streptomyces profundus TaxID=2867410 RepID=UPI001D168C21|nr:TIGR02678 family protein [Streptomyces sp. MA3_2.13]UED83195.1 TIGR02678 family protein [Streptomyces sp. MA3_2.13]
MSGRGHEAAFERGAVIRALLAQPLLHRRGRHTRTLDLARRHQTGLRAWFDHHLGWRLHVERDRLRLFKVPETSDRLGTEAPTARQCVLYCLLLTVLEDCGQQTVLSELAERITALSSAHARLRRFEATVHRERTDLVAMVRLLYRQGVLATPNGETSTTREHEKEYVAGDGDALYDVDHRTAALLLAAPIPPAEVEGPQALFDAMTPDDTGFPAVSVRHALMRRLVDEPTVYWDDLPGNQREYFHEHADELLSAVRLGLDVRVEVRAEGAAVIDEELTDLEFPKSSAASFAALILADKLCAETERAVPRRTFVSRARIRELSDEIAPELLKLIANIKGQPIDGARVQEAALPILLQLGLAEHVPGGIRVRPALARYRAPAGHGLRSGADDLMLFGTHDLPDSPAPAKEDDRDDTTT